MSVAFTLVQRKEKDRKEKRKRADSEIFLQRLKEGIAKEFYCSNQKEKKIKRYLKRT